MTSSPYDLVKEVRHNLWLLEKEAVNQKGFGKAFAYRKSYCMLSAILHRLREVT